MRLTADAYSQETIMLRDSRLRLALAIWKSGIEGPEYPCCPGPLGEEVESGGTRLPPSKRAKRKRRDMGQRQRKRSGQSLLLKRTRIQGQEYMVTFLKKRRMLLVKQKSQRGVSGCQRVERGRKNTGVQTTKEKKDNRRGKDSKHGRPAMPSTVTATALTGF